MYLHALLTWAPEKAWGQLCTSGCFTLGDSAPFIPFGIATIWMLWRKEKPAPLSGTEHRPSDLKARHLVTIVPYPDGGSILLWLKRPYIPVRLHGVNPRRRLFRSPCCHNLKTPHQYVSFLCARADHVPYTHLAFKASLCTLL